MVLHIDGVMLWSHIKARFRKLMMGSWQKEWGKGETRKLIFDINPNVKTRPISSRKEEIIFLTCRGPFGAYLKRFHPCSAAMEELVPTSPTPLYLYVSSQNHGTLKDQSRRWKIFCSKGSQPNSYPGIKSSILSDSFTPTVSFLLQIKIT
ncbi:hypothetical protein AVEN_173863-1 [Araneus ventricosus]|uniref:Uncharacterized protein n=1 Tax=Araneus ventricosus TaxID=182803 RepID=A0A4Y2I0R3_ARAVE|nr:hypothetical protein AVEN_173863-1 [Araneus ventricosus]